MRALGSDEEVLCNTHDSWRRIASSTRCAASFDASCGLPIGRRAQPSKGLDFVPPLWRDAIVEDDGDSQGHVNRITYEIAELNALRDQLRCKEVHVAGADRYRDPDEDVPRDFEGNQRESYYAALQLPLDAGAFLDGLRDEMRNALQTLNDGVPSNSAVTISSKAGGWISLSPLDPQLESTNSAPRRRSSARFSSRSARLRSSSARVTANRSAHARLRPQASL